MKSALAEDQFEIVACPCCDQAGSRIWVDEGRGTQYRLCCECGTVFASPRVAHDQRVKAFESGWGKETALRIERLRRAALRKIAAVVQTHKHGGRLLDCGCSSGAFFESFERKSWECHGVELSPSASAHAAVRTGALVHTGTLTSARYPSAYFDLITILDSFYYFDDPHEQLEECRRLLKPDGILGIEIPGGGYSKARSRGPLCLLLGWRWYRLTNHSHYLFIYSAKGFQRLVKKAGFALAGVETVPSPETSKLSNLFSRTHYAVMRRLLPRWPTLAHWSPKVLWIFNKKADRASAVACAHAKPVAGHRASAAADRGSVAPGSPSDES